MRFSVPKNLARSSGFHKSLKDEPVEGIFGPCGEFAVGECAGAAQAKLDVTARVELACAVEVLDVARPTCGIGAALDKERFKAGMGQSEGGKEACAARAYDDG